MTDLGIDNGLYGNDGLAACDLKSRRAESMKKKIKENGFSITVNEVSQLLDINLNLDLETFKPYMKPNSVPVYVHKDSNHPRSILENIPKSINRKLSTISSNQEVFRAACPPYQAALKKWL